MRHRLLLLAIGVFLAGCATRPVNPPLTQIDKSSGYRGNLVIPKRTNNEVSTLFILAFSGGGTRAASLSYGVLEELRRTEFTAPNGQARRLLDEVDVSATRRRSSASAGSAFFSSAAHAAAATGAGRRFNGRASAR